MSATDDKSATDDNGATTNTNVIPSMATDVASNGLVHPKDAPTMEVQIRSNWRLQPTPTSCSTKSLTN